MIAVALRGLWGRKLRATLTAIAIVLGVAMISGAYVLTDTISSAFDTIFTQSYKNSDVVITGKSAFTNDEGNGVDTPSFPASLLTQIQDLPDVAAAAGSITDDSTQLVGRDGKLISNSGAPNLAFGVDPKELDRFRVLTLVSGSWPRNGEIAIDKATADDQNLQPGDTVGVESRGPVRRFKITGIAKFADVQSIGGATISVFDIPTAQKLLKKEGKLDVIRVQSRAGVPTDKLLAQIKPLLPPSAQARDVADQVKEDKKGVGFIGIFQKVLLAFGGVALFVGAFVIVNTLSITIAQQAREFATLRTIGASRRQVMWSVVLEALVIGIFASVIGLFAGLGIAKGLNALFVAVGIDLPKASTVFATRTIVVSLLVGVVITLLASLRPAFRATRVPPIAAVREGSVLPPSRFARFGTVGGLAVVAVGVALLLLGIFVHGQSVALHLLEIGVGVLLLFVGVAIFAPRIVPPLARVLGWPGAKIGGIGGELARDNAMRNPSRTASTAAALMIGLALVTFVAIVAQGLRSSFESAVNQLFIADYALTSPNTFNPVTVDAQNALEGVPGLTTVSGIRAGSARYLGGVHNLTAVDPNMAKVIHVDWKEGSSAVPAQLGDNGMFTDDDFAKDHHLTLGSPMHLELPNGKRLNVVVRGVFDKPKGGSPFAEATISSKLFDANFPRPENEMALMNIQGGVTTANTAALEKPLKAFPDAKVQTRDQFKTNFLKPLNNLLNLLYALLGLSVIVSVFGIVNTLVLTVFERTRELGMLRAVGMTRRQTRRMIRHESIVTALIGAVLGIVLGIFLAALVTSALSSQGFVFAVPWFSLVIFVVAAIVVGVLAAVLPARRASRLNILRALQYE